MSESLSVALGRVSLSGVSAESVTDTPEDDRKAPEKSHYAKGSTCNGTAAYQEGRLAVLRARGSGPWLTTPAGFPDSSPPGCRAPRTSEGRRD